MIHRPPAGARDLLPLEVAQKRWINDCVHSVFQQWGYQRIVTSTVEKLETLMAGGAIAPSTVVQIQDTEEGSLGLRPELTASIARASVTRMAGESYPQRLCYRSNVFRRPPASSQGGQIEYYQSGVELLGASGTLANAEILLLLANCLHELELQDWHLILGETGLSRSLLAPFPESQRASIRQCIAHLDRVTLEQLSLSSELMQRALTIFDLRGKPEDVLAKVASLELDAQGEEIVKNLKSLVDLLRVLHSEPLPIILDLSLFQTIDYYTGIVFEAIGYTETEKLILAQGGRYDQLLGQYHPKGKNYAGIGFTFNLEDLHSCLLVNNKLPYQSLASHWLVIPATPEAEVTAFQYAQTLRNTNHVVRVEIELEARSPDEIRQYGRDRGISYLAWVNEEGTPEIEVL